MRPVRQLSQSDAQALFDYKNGRLYWRHASSGHRRDRAAISIQSSGKPGRKKYYSAVVIIGIHSYSAHYVVWNWHMGPTDKAVVFKDGDRTNCDFRNLMEVPRAIKKIIGSKSRVILSDGDDNFIGSKSRVNHCCPTCTQPIDAPTYDTIVINYGLQPMQARVLRAVWAGKGHPVMPGKIFNVMYEDDEDGGPNEPVMYKAFKVALCRLRKSLEGSGVSIETCGYRAGYRLVLEGNK